MDAPELFAANLPLLDRVIAGVCRRAGLRDADADAEDFASTVKITLMENDFAILRSYEGRSSLGSYLTVVVQRLLLRERARMWGRWHASAEAESLGPPAVLLEKLLLRDGRSLDEAVPLVRAVEPHLDHASVCELAARLPHRAPRPRLVALPFDEHDLASPERTDNRARENDARRTSKRAARIVCEALATLSLDDRMLMRFRFGAGMSIADAARMLRVPQRPLYRRIEALLKQLRHALEREGVNATAVEDIIAANAAEGVDFGLHTTRHANEREEQC